MPAIRQALLLAPLLALIVAAQAAHAAQHCQQLRFDASVKGEQNLVKDIGSGLRFRMESQGDTGWQFEIGATKPKADVFDSYVYLLTPPFRSRHATALDTSYGTLAQEATSPEPVTFWFLLRPADASKAHQIIETILWPQTDDPARIAVKKLGRLARGTGELRVLRADIRPGKTDPKPLPDDADYGAIYGMTVRVSLTVPASFRPAAGIRSRPVACPDPAEWPLEEMR